jgi:hypothetical protein
MDLCSDGGIGAKSAAGTFRLRRQDTATPGFLQDHCSVMTSRGRLRIDRRREPKGLRVQLSPRRATRLLMLSPILPAWPTSLATLQGPQPRWRWLPTHAVKGITKTVLAPITDVKAGRYEGATFTPLLDHGVFRTRREVFDSESRRCLPNQHHSKEARENDGGHSHDLTSWLAGSGDCRRQALARTLLVRAAGLEPAQEFPPEGF